MASIPIERRLLKRRVIDSATGCWNWTGATDVKGEYGRIVYNGKLQMPHRVSAMLYLGMRDDEWALHKCDNPRCFNPEHLFKGDRSANVKDSVSKKRHVNSRKVSCIYGHPLTGENLEITKSGKRRCRTCHCRHNANSLRRIKYGNRNRNSL